MTIVFKRSAMQSFNRKPLFTAILFSVLWSVGVRGFCEGQEAANSNRPNIIFFLLDDYDKSECSVYGGKVLTPNLDRLARDGMTMTNVHMTATVCTPSRYTCLTGRYASSCYAEYYLNECPLGQQALPAFNVELEPDNRNVAQMLSKHGYVTGFVGKYHIGPHIDKTNAKDYDWQYIPKNVAYTPEIERKKQHNQKVACQLIRKKGFDWVKNVYWENMKAPFKGHNPEWTAHAALEFIDKYHKRPFFLYYATTLMHGPNGEWFKSLDKPLVTDAGMLTKPLGLMDRESVMRRITAAGLTENEAGYLWMDDSVGLVLDRLDQLGIAEDTIFVFLADHGSKRKGSLLKNFGTEVPCLIRWPAGIKAGVVCDELAQSTDFVATWFDVAKVSLPKSYRLDGVSLAPLFKHPDRPVRDYVYAEIGPARSIKTKKWNYVALRYTQEQIKAIEAGQRSVKKLLGLSGGVSRAGELPNAFDTDQLYDLEKDASEQRNVYSSSPEVVREMQKHLLRELQTFDKRPFGEFIPGGNAVPGSKQGDLAPRLRQLRSKF